MADYKLTYLSHIFSNIDRKGFETYVIARIWNKLDNLDIKIVCQQYVKRENGYALLDLYFPQIKMGVEVNEAYHLSQPEADLMRKKEVEVAVGVEIKTVDCSQSIDHVHQQIDDIVKTINERIQFGIKPWCGKMTPEEYQRAGVLRIEDEIILSNADEICQIFGLEGAPRRGYLRTGGVPISKDTLVWWPNATHSIWANEMSDDGETIVEYNKSDANERKRHVDKHLATNELRITFYRKRDNFGLNYYRFVGVYKMDKDASKKEHKCIWRRVATEYKL